MDLDLGCSSYYAGDCIYITVDGETIIMDRKWQQNFFML